MFEICSILIMNDKEFYMNCAIAAMQGMMESGTKFSEIAAVLLPKKLANEAFNIADAMLEEYRKRSRDKFESIPDHWGNEMEEEL